MLHIYRASAGSGKTYTLTFEYIKLLLGYRNEQGMLCLFPKGRDMHRHILAVTFTNKATEEMKRRIIAELNVLAHEPERSAYLRDLTREFACDAEAVSRIAGETLFRLLHDFSFFNISTIDKFFQQALRAFTRDLGLPGGFNVELDDKMVIAEAIDRLFSDLDDPSQKTLLEWLISYTSDQVEEGKSWNINRSSGESDIFKLAKELSKETYKQYRSLLLEVVSDKSVLLDYQRSMRKIIQEFVGELCAIGKEAMELIRNAGLSVEDFKYGTSSAPSYFRKMEQLTQPKFDPPSARFRKAVDNEREWYKDDSPKRAELQAAYPALNTLAVRLCELLDGERYRMFATAVATGEFLYVLGILIDIDKRIEEYQVEHNTFLLSETSGILNQIINESDAPFIYEKLGTQIDHFMIDEFQDTSSLQWRNFSPLVSESLSHGRDNLIVGDAKQSIYRFRNSDWQLLSRGLGRQFPPEQRRDFDMEVNWRSARNIVGFNNAFFQQSVLRTAAQLQAEIDAAGNRACDDYPKLFLDAYKDVCQRVSPKENLPGGHVVVRMWEPERTTDFREEALERIPDTVRALQDRGYEARDIVFLVRKNEEGADIIDLLLKLKAENDDPRYNFDVISNESLLLCHAPVVKMAIGVLHYMQSPDSEINRFQAFYDYATALSPDAESNVVSRYFKDRETAEEMLREIARQVYDKPLFEMCEQIFTCFSDKSDRTETAYIQAFQDCVLDYTRNHSAGLLSFLEWWELKKEKLSVNTPDGQNAIRVMTIHKSKGLEFRAVVIPFCDWSLDSSRAPLIWCSPQVEPFDRLPVVPLKYGSRLGNTYYAREYYREKVNQYIDSLNVAYVAFTRAREELVVFAPLPKKEREIKTIGSLLSVCLSEPALPLPEGMRSVGMPVRLDTGDTDNEIKYEAGAEWYPVSEAEPVSEPALYIPEYVSIDPADRLHLRLQGKGAFQESRDRIYGTWMHRILSEIRYGEDIDAVVERYRFAGELSAEEAERVTQLLRRWISDERTCRWFAADATVLNESEILLPEGSFYRPDRVVIHPDRTVEIVDYKFGTVERKSYLRQIGNYVNLVRSMGYDNVSGYLWYITIDKIVPAAGAEA